MLIISIGVVFDFNENIDRFTESHAPWKAIVMQYYLNFIPYYANLFSALFVFISVIFFTSKMADGSEIIAMISAGISYRRLLVPYMISSAIIAAMTFYLGAEVIPRSSIKRLAFENTYKKRNKKWEDDFSPIDPTGTTWADTFYSRPYLHHLFKAQELLALQIASIHNLAFYLWLVGEARKHIIAGDFTTWKAGMVKQVMQRL